MTLYLDEDRTIKPFVFFGVMLLFANLFITIVMYLTNTVYTQQWFYPDIINLIFLILSSIGTALLVIGLVPGLKKV